MNVKALKRPIDESLIEAILGDRINCDDFSNFGAQICISKLISALVISRKNAAGNARLFLQEAEVNIRH